MFDRILVLCLGNICRSPIAEALLRHQYVSKTIDSAGIHALVGAPADEMSQLLMKERNIDISHHRGKQLTPHLLNQADLVLVMSQGQKQEVEVHYPFTRGRVFLIDHWNHQRSIPDPYQQPRYVFEHSLQLIEEGLVAWKPYL